MSDPIRDGICDRLRSWRPEAGATPPSDLMRLAADWIEQHRREIDKLQAEIGCLRGRNQRNAQDLREYAAILAGEMADMVADECQITVQRMV